ncbi:hypothetical protein LTR17_023792 [Elasticomyces elasticus]|nr:hypothetical protein LTR17_023792 [Elasticomyces elasticus]
MPTPISHRYYRYKAGTTKITRWLKTAARRCSDIEHSLATLCIADDAAATSARGSMTTQDLVRLATVVATSTPPKVEIPLDILVVIEDVIEGRQAGAEWYAGTDHGDDGETEQANRRHWLPKSYKKRPEKLELDKAAVLDNMDEYLELEDPKAPTKTASPRRVARSVPLRAAPRQGDEQSLLQDLEQTDKVFALWCIFKDHLGSCNFHKDAWQEYKDGKLSFIAICNMRLAIHFELVTGTAFILMQKANVSLTAQYPDFRDMDGVDEFLGFTLVTISL